MPRQPKSFSPIRTAKRLVTDPAFRAVAHCAMVCAIRAAHPGRRRAKHGLAATPG